MNSTYPPQKHHRLAGGRWSQYTLKRQLLTVFVLCVVLSLITAELISITFLLLISSNISTTSSNVLFTQLSDNLAHSVVHTAASFFEREINRIVDSGLTIVNNALSDSLRSDYSTGSMPSFFDSLEFLDRPTAQPDSALRYPGKRISLTHSSWTVPEATSATPPAVITAEQQRIRDSTSKVDSFFRTVYDQTPAIVSIYAGFTNGLFRVYPGTAEREVGTSSTPSAYDPRTRSWYQLSMSRTGANVPITSRTDRVVIGPYLDFVGKGWQLTTGRAIRDVNDNTTDIGVAAVASTLIVMTERLKEFTLGNSSIVAIYSIPQKGVALFHPDWDLKAAVGVRSGLAPFTYANSTKPRITEAFWKEIASTSDQSISTANTAYKSKVYADPDTGVSYLVIWKTLTVTDGSTQSPTWVCVGSIPLSVVTQPVDAVRNDMSTTVLRTVLISITVFISISLLVIILVTGVANAAVRPLAKLSDETTRISNNIGTKDLFRGVDVDDASESRRRGLATVDETENLSERFYSLVRRIREGSEGSSGARGAANLFFGNTGVPGWNAGKMDPTVVGMLPDQPPPLYAVKEEVAVASTSLEPVPPVSSAAGAAKTQ